MTSPFRGGVGRGRPIPQTTSTSNLISNIFNSSSQQPQQPKLLPEWQLALLTANHQFNLHQQNPRKFPPKVCVDLVRVMLRHGRWGNAIDCLKTYLPVEPTAGLEVFWECLESKRTNVALHVYHTYVAGLATSSTWREASLLHLVRTSIMSRDILTLSLVFRHGGVPAALFNDVYWKHRLQLLGFTKSSLCRYDKDYNAFRQYVVLQSWASSISALSKFLHKTIEQQQFDGDIVHSFPIQDLRAFMKLAATSNLWAQAILFHRHVMMGHPDRNLHDLV
eukprot:PhF_6_TR6967/c0_g1_i1/m.10286